MYLSILNDFLCYSCKFYFIHKIKIFQAGPTALIKPGYLHLEVHNRKCRYFILSLLWSYLIWCPVWYDEKQAITHLIYKSWRAFNINQALLLAIMLLRIGRHNMIDVEITRKQIHQTCLYYRTSANKYVIQTCLRVFVNEYYSYYNVKGVFKPKQLLFSLLRNIVWVRQGASLANITKKKNGVIMFRKTESLSIWSLKWNSTLF